MSNRFLCIVGFGSWMFHMTLKYEMQLFDELPMLWGSLMLLYCLITLLYPKIDESLVYTLLLKLGLISYGISSTLLYLCFKTPILFQVSYGFLVVVMLYLDICVAKYMPSDRRVFYWAAAFYYSGLYSFLTFTSIYLIKNYIKTINI